MANHTPAGKFKKGKSGNPSGRPKVVGEVKEIARQHTEAAIKTLVSICNDAEQPAAARVAASNAILDRGYGKPPQAHTGEDGQGAIRLEIVNYGSDPE